MTTALMRNSRLNGVDSLLDSFADGFFGLGHRSDFYEKSYPSYRVTRESDQSVVEFLVPGIDPATIEVLEEDGNLLVKGKLPNWFNQGADEKPLEFAYRLSLPKDTDMDSIKAETKHGILKITCGKKPKNVRSIDVKMIE